MRIEAHGLASAVYLRLGQPDAARSHAERAVALGARLGTPYALGIAERANARFLAASKPSAAKPAFDAALRHFAAARIPYERATTLLDYIELLNSLGEPAERSHAACLEASRLLEGLNEQPVIDFRRANGASMVPSRR
jgi:hypothetical protein